MLRCLLLLGVSMLVIVLVALLPTLLHLSDAPTHHADVPAREPPKTSPLPRRQLDPENDEPSWQWLLREASRRQLDPENDESSWQWLLHEAKAFQALRGNQLAAEEELKRLRGSADALKGKKFSWKIPVYEVRKETDTTVCIQFGGRSAPVSWVRRHNRLGEILAAYNAGLPLTAEPPYYILTASNVTVPISDAVRKLRNGENAHLCGTVKSISVSFSQDDALGKVAPSYEVEAVVDEPFVK